MIKKRYIHLPIAAALMLGIYQSAFAVAINFFTDQSSFLAAISGTTTTIDFEGIFPDNQWGTPEQGASTFNGNNTTVDGVTFTVSTGTIGVSGKNGPVAGSPYNSALLFSNNDGAITADMTGVGPVYALGAWFGDISGSSSTSLTLVGTSGILDVQTVTAGDMGLGSLETFYGWTVIGDTILNVTHSTTGAGSRFEGIDDLIYSSDVAPVPEPATLALFGIGLAGLGFARKKRKSV